MASQASSPISPSLVLEITLLTTSPSSTPSLILTQLQNVRTDLAAKVLPTHSKFYHSGDSNEVYILGFWPSLKSHLNFLADEKLSHEILSPQKDVLDWAWTGHVQLGLENVDPTREKLHGIKMVEIKRWIVEVSRKDVFFTSLSNLKSVDAERGVLIAEGWGVDSESNLGEGRTEYIRIYGWVETEVTEAIMSVHQDHTRDPTPSTHQQEVGEMSHGVYIDME